jgi:hypothetical protein
MLFKTIEEFAKHVTFNKSIELTTFEQYIKDAENEFLIPIIGQDLYDKLNTDYNASNTALASPFNILLEKCQSAIAPMAFSLYIPFGHAQVSKVGIQNSSTETNKTAFQWQIKQLVEASQTKAHSRAAKLMSCLFNSTYDFGTEWTESDEYLRFKNLLVTTIIDFNKYTSKPVSFYAFFNFYSLMLMAEDNDCASIISPEYLEELRTKKVADSLNDDDKKVVKDLQSAIVSLTLARACEEYMIDFNSLGITVSRESETLNNTSKEPAEARERNQFIQAKKTQANHVLNKLKTYLNTNADSFTTFKESVFYTPPAEPIQINSQESTIFIV